MSQGSLGTSVLLYDANGDPLVLGSTTSASSLPVVIASDQAAVAIKDGGSSITVDATSMPLPADAATETTLAALNTNAADIETILTAIRDTTGVKKITDQLPAGTNNIGDVDVASSALPAGAATEATVATLATQATAALIKAKTDNLDVLLSTRATEATVATLATQTTVAAINTATGTTADADTALTVIGRLKQIITKLAGGLPAALTGSGNLKVAQQEAMPAGTNRLGSVRLVDANDVALDLARNTTVPAGSRGLLIVGEDGTGKAQAADVRVDALDGIRRLQIAGSITLSPPAAPPATTAVTITFEGALAISTDQTDNYIITNAKRFVVQQIVCGSEGDSTEKGSCIEVSYFNGTTAFLLERVYINGFTTEVYPQTDKSRNGTLCDGNGTTKTIRLVRRRLSGASQEVDVVIRGYEYTP